MLLACREPHVLPRYHLQNDVIQAGNLHHATQFFHQLNSGNFSATGSAVNAAPEGIAIRKGDNALVKATQAAFHAVKADGTYQQLVQKWGQTHGGV